MNIGRLLIAIGSLLVAALLGAVCGALGTAVTALIVAGGSYYIGFIGIGLAQAVALWMVAGGALIGAVGAVFNALFLGAALG